MAHNGDFEENGGIQIEIELESGDRNDSHQDKRRRLSDMRSALSEILKSGEDPDSMERRLERFIVGYADKEVELALAEQKNPCDEKCNSGNEKRLSKSRSLRLRFIGKISSQIFTGEKIKGEESTSIRVELVDGHTGQVVNFGPEASAPVEIVVLDKDFKGNEADNWTPEDFNRNIVLERNGRSPLLSGDVSLNLEEGTGLIGGVYFANTSHAMAKDDFRLGARITDVSLGIRVREAKTDCFTVRDYRLKSNKKHEKHHPPSLCDEVWRLEKIYKDGAFHKRLSRDKVNTVQDFLKLLFLDPSKLKKILGRGMSANRLEATIAHARTCIPRLYLYHPPASQQKTGGSGVVFNVMGEVVALLSECQYAPVDMLSETEKAEAHKLVITAFEHWEDVASVDDEVSLKDGSSRLFNNVLCLDLAREENSDGNKRLTSQKVGVFDYGQPSASASHIPSIYSTGKGDVDSLHNIDNMDVGYDQSLDFPGQVPNFLSEPISQPFCEDVDSLHDIDNMDQLFFDTELFHSI